MSEISTEKSSMLHKVIEGSKKVAKWCWDETKKTAIAVSLFVVSSCSMSTSGAASPKSPFESNSGEGAKPKTEQLANATSAAKAKLDEMKLEKAKLEKELAASTITKYKGLSINLDSIQPQEIAHVFESGLNPCITDGNRSIQNAAYLGLCQMAINTTLPNFIEQRCNGSTPFKSLYTFKKNGNIRSSGFMNEWKRLSYGPHAAEFERAQFEFMFDLAYKPVFDKLAKTGYFPEITLDNYAAPENFVYSAAVMSCVNQNPKRTDEIFLRSLNNICIQALKENKIQHAASFNPGVKDYKTRRAAVIKDVNANIALVRKHNLNIDDSYTNIALETYPTKEVVFGKMGGRYVQEKNLLQEKADRLEKQAAYAQISSDLQLAQEATSDKTTYEFYASSNIAEPAIDISQQLSDARERVATSSSLAKNSKRNAVDNNSKAPQRKNKTKNNEAMVAAIISQNMNFRG